MIAPAASERAVIDRAGAADLDAIMALERDGFDAGARWSDASWRAELTGPDRCVLVDRDGTVVRGVATFQVVAEVADLHRVVVAPDRRGRGIARALVGAGLAWAAGRRARHVLLEVEHDNVAALALYRPLGFTELARRRDYYGAGRHALVMRRELAGAVDGVGMGELA